MVVGSRRFAVAWQLAGWALMLGGCALVDQSTFGGKPLAPAPDQLASALASDGGVPLVVIQAGDGVAYAGALHEAVAEAEARNPNVRFRLESVVPAAGDLNTQQRALQDTSAQARAVMDVMGQQGISPERVTLAARTEAGVRRPEIRLYAA